MKSPSIRSAKTGIVLLSIVACIALSLLATWQVREQEIDKWDKIFNASCHDITSKVQIQVKRRIDKLISIRAFFYSSENITRPEFKTFVYSSEAMKLDAYVIAWAPLIKKEQKEKLLKIAHDNGYTEYHIHSRDNSNIIAPKYMMPILHFKPAHPPIANKLRGLDLLTTKHDTQKKILLSIQQNKPIVGYFQPSQHLHADAWIIIIPVYKDMKLKNLTNISNLRGIIFGVFYIENVVEAAFNTFAPKGIDAVIKEVGKTDSKILAIHKSRLQKTTKRVPTFFSPPPLSKTDEITICEKKYIIEYHTTPAFYRQLSTFDSSSFFLISMLLSILIIAAVWIQTFKTRTVERLVDERTEALKKSQEKLASSAEFLRNILDSFPHPILVLNSNFKVIKANKAAKKEISCTKCEVSCCAIMQCDGGECPHDDCFANKVITTGKVHEKSIVRIIDGEERNYKVVAAPFTSEKGITNQVVMSFIDITLEKHISSRKLQAQKMEAIGQLAGGIAHDINNLLQVISGYAELAKPKVQDNEKLKKYVDQIHKSCRKAGELTNSILAFGRKQAMQLKVLDLNQLIFNFEKMLQRVIPEVIRLEFIPSPKTCIIEADPNMMEQIIMNLCVNARDAMKDATNGKIIIKTDRVTMESTCRLTSFDLTPGEYIMLSVTDSGTGIKQKVIDKIFDPFFTTKSVGKGTGLGLSTVFGIVKQHKGAIIPETELGKGTTFTIYLPASGNSVEESVEHTVTIPATTKNAKVLLVEDNKELLEMNTALLEGFGYKVFKAVNGKEAYEILKKEKNNINMLISDVVMPDMTGNELYSKFPELNIKIPVLFVSGYAKDSINIHPDVEFLAKPFSNTKLLTKVNEMLKVSMKNRGDS